MNPLGNNSNLLIVGDNASRVGLVANAIKHFLPRAKTIECNSLRIGSPEVKLQNLTAMILLWENNPMTEWRQLISQEAPTGRSFEGIVWQAANTCGEKILRRIAILTDGLSKDEVLFLAEFNIRCVQTMGSDATRLKEDIGKFLKKVRKMIEDEDNGGCSSSDRARRRFEMALERWHRLDDIQKMYLCNDVHKQFGHSATYFELMARRAIVVNNHAKAEVLLQQSLSKNPNQTRAKQELADLYMSKGAVQDALQIYLEMHRANPRHPSRIAKIADCYFKLGRMKDADRICSHALSLDQLAERARENLALTRTAWEDYDAARELIKKGVDANEFAARLNSIGIQFVKAGRFGESIEHYKRAEHVLPNNDVRHMLLLNIGIAYAKWGKFVEAKQYARLALDRQSNYEKARQLLNSLNDKFENPECALP